MPGTSSLARRPGLHGRGVRYLPAIIVLLLGGPAAEVEAQDRGETPTAVVRGRVVAHDGGRPLPGVEVGIEGTSLWATTDDEGEFDLGPVPVGERVLRARTLGYEERSDSMVVRRGVVLYVTLTLATDPVELDELRVTTRSPVLSRNGFYERQEQGYGGVFIERPEIERRSPASVTDLFRNVSGVRVVYGGIHGSRVFVNQRVNFQDANRPGCEPTLWLDGIRSTMASYDMMRTEEIEGIEVYAGGGAPGRFNDMCGTVVIWTRVPLRG